MEVQEGKAWEGTASDLYNKLKEIVGEATTKGKEWPANAQALSRRKNSLASTLRPFGIEINREKRSGGIRHIEISARPESARKIAPIAPNAAVGAENAMIDCATTRPIAPGESEGGGGRGRNGRNSTASFRETDEGTSPPPADLEQLERNGRGNGVGQSGVFQGDAADAVDEDIGENREDQAHLVGLVGVRAHAVSE